MNSANFNPSGVGVKNGNYFGFPFSPEESEIVLVSVPWDVTTSYKPGAHLGPKAIKEASVQLDFYDFDVAEAWKIKIGTLPADKEIEKLNKKLRPFAQRVISHLEEGGSEVDAGILEDVAEVNKGSERINQKVFEFCMHWLQNGKKVGLVGGDHSVPFGYVKALSQIHSSFGILHIDAHADLREAYEGFEHSHASIMFNLLQNKAVEKLVQLAIRDVSAPEMELAANHPKIAQFSDALLQQNAFRGIYWHDQCQQIVSCLPPKVYISFDIDGLEPGLCPNTGTPVAGGLTFNQAVYVVKTLVESGREIIGFDLNEVAPGTTDWDANVGARILLKLINLTIKSGRA